MRTTSATTLRYSLLPVLLGVVLSTKANNLDIGIPAVSGNTITFSIAWENSWRSNMTPSNFDAVWVFVKRQSCTDNLWVHAPVSTGSVHTVTGGVLEVVPTNDGMGVFVRRSALGSGNIATSTVTLTLQSMTNGVDNFQVFGIEMVAVPQGDFRIGNSATYGFNSMTITSAIQSAGLGVWTNYINNSWASTGALPGTFPLGWNNFYIMKYEISQEQYRAFLNCLTYEQQAVRMAASPDAAAGTLAMTTAGAVNRNGLRINVPGISNNTPAVIGSDLNANGLFNEAADGQNIACNYLSWADLIAYLDWAALRPMTEFEFEKVCRGVDTPVTIPDYAWGPSFLVQASSAALSNSGGAAEASSTAGAGLCAFGESGSTNGPLRCGFAAGATTTRLQAGAAWYGVMDLSGNVMEQCVGGRNFNFAGFTTANGDGTLHWSGLANTTGWPVAGGGLDGGAIVRGGSWNSPAGELAVSDRTYILNNVNRARSAAVGGRGVRSF